MNLPRITSDNKPYKNGIYKSAVSNMWRIAEITELHLFKEDEPFYLPTSEYRLKYMYSEGSTDGCFADKRSLEAIFKTQRLVPANKRDLAKALLLGFQR